MQLASDVDRVLRRQLVLLTHQPAIPGHAGLHRRVVRGVEPDLAPAPAEAGDAQLAGVAAVGGRPLHRGVQVAQHLRVGHLADHFRDELGHLAVALGVALAHEQLGRDGEVARLGEAARGVGDVLVHAEDLGQHQHHRKARPAGGRGAVGRHPEAVHVDHDLTDRQTVGRRADGGLGHQRHRGGGVAHAQRGLEGRSAGGAGLVGAASQQGLGVAGHVVFEHRGSPQVVG